jgi:hypothetical protein
LIIPENCAYLWEHYHEISSGVGRVRDGVFFPIPWTEFLAWANVTGNLVLSGEYAILRAMDLVFCEETNKSLIAYREKMLEKSKSKKA